MLHKLFTVVALSMACFGLVNGETVAFGDATVCSIYDGYFDIDQRMFVNADPANLQQLLEDSNTACVSPLVVRTQVYGFLVDTGDLLVLVDSGCGLRCGANTGLLTENLNNAGYNPADIDLVLITHLHPDHVGGLLTANGDLAFPSATVCLSEIEASYWCNRANEVNAIDDAKPCFALAIEMLAPYAAKGQLRQLAQDAEIAPGIQAVSAIGHTPGHTAFLFSSQGEQLLLWGDLVHSAGIQFAQPGYFVFFDSNGPQAAASRLKIFEQVADQPILIGGAHMPAPGFGHVLRTENAFQWTPFAQ